MLGHIKSSFPLRLSLIFFFLVFACAFFKLSGLTEWDGIWYRHIVENGYSAIHSADRTVEGKGNVGFFPGYPLAVYFVKKTIGLGSDFISTNFALILTSNLFALLFWNFLSQWLDLFSAKNIRVKMCFLALYPYCFFFYCAYTESMFTAMVLGFFYFTEKWVREENETQSWKWFTCALLAGFFMNFTRLLGCVMVAYPLIRAVQLQEKKKRALLLASGSLSSIAVFFVYCQFKFNAWDFYFISERAIWNTFIDWGKLFPPAALFNFSRPFHADTVSKYMTLILGIFLPMKLVQLVKTKQWRSPFFAVLICSGMLWGEYLLGRTSWDFGGMGRYLIPVLALILPFVKMEPKLNWKWVLAGSVLLIFEIAYALKFARHGWVA